MHGQLDVFVQVQQLEAASGGRGGPRRRRGRRRRGQGSRHQTRGAGEVLHQHQIGPVGLEAILDAAQELDLELDAGGYALVGQATQHLHDGPHGQDAVDDHLEAGLVAALEALGQVLEPADAGQDAAGLVEGGQAGGGEHGAVSGAVEERDAQGLLQLADGAGHGGLGAVEGAGCSAEAARPIDGVQHLEGVQGEGHAHLPFI
ncbi:MAG: hypothetical protein R3F43_26120 [bacterium]